MKISSIMETIICSNTLAELKHLCSTDFRPPYHHPLLRRTWVLHPKKRHWCCVSCSCPVPSEPLNTFVVVPYSYSTQFDLHYTHRTPGHWDLRIHMPWSTFNTTLYVLAQDPDALRRLAHRRQTTCLTVAPHMLT